MAGGFNTPGPASGKQCVPPGASPGLRVLVRALGLPQERALGPAGRVQCSMKAKT